MTPVFRASELDRILSCNGSITLVPLVNPRESDDGDEGTYLHWLIASRLISELGATPPDGGLPPPDVPKDYKLPPTSAWIVEWAVRHVRDTVPSDWSLLVEVPLAYSFPRWDNSGHIDWLALNPEATKAIGGDWKSGRDPVDPADSNWQTFDYQCLTKRAWESLQEVVFQICQPRVTEDDEVERVSTCTLGGDRLERANDTLDAAVCVALDNRMELNSGRKQCRWCPVGAQCEALQLELDEMKVTLTKESIARVRKTPDDALLGDWVIKSRMLAQPMKDAVEILHTRLDTVGVINAASGATITRDIEPGGYELVDPVAFYRAALEDLKTPERMAAVFKPAITRLTDQLAEALNINRGGLAPVTAEGVVGARYKPFLRQNQKRMLRISQ
jgi:hypothetical protein